MSFLSDMEAKLAADCQAVASEIKAAAQWFVSQVVTDAEKFVQDFSAVAIQAVLTEAPKLLSGQEKFGSAVTSVFQKGQAAALNIGIQDAQMLVQAAYRQVQAQAGAH